MLAELSSDEYKTLDFADPAAILSYAKKLEGHTFQDVLDLGIIPDGKKKDYGKRGFKGGKGTLIEERYFGYSANNDERPDFHEAGIELKTTCYDVRKRPKKGQSKIGAGERLVLCMIPFDRAIADELADTHLWMKMAHILLVYYHREKDRPKGDRGYGQTIGYVRLFSPPDDDLPIIEGDYRKIRDLIVAGRGQDLSESLTLYLGACTKGQSAKDRTKQFYPPHDPVKRRAFCYKRQYMEYVLNHYVIGGEAEESIIKDPSVLKAPEGFEGRVATLIKPFVGMTDREIADELGIPYTANKAQWSSLAFHMLGLSGDRAAEFDKAGINARAVRIEKRGIIEQNLSFAPFRFKDLAADGATFEESNLYRYLEETRFFFVVFQMKEHGYVLQGSRFWNMPMADLDGPVRECWERARAVVRRGVTLIPKTTKAGIRYENDLPKESDGLIVHVRPHAKRAAYLIPGECRVGNIERDADELPDGRWMTKQSFWLNHGYVLKVLRDL